MVLGSRARPGTKANWHEPKTLLCPSSAIVKREKEGAQRKDVVSELGDEIRV